MLGVRVLSVFSLMNFPLDLSTSPPTHNDHPPSPISSLIPSTPILPPIRTPKLPTHFTPDLTPSHSQVRAPGRPLRRSLHLRLTTSLTAWLPGACTRCASWPAAVSIVSLFLRTLSTPMRKVRAIFVCMYVALSAQIPMEPSVIPGAFSATSQCLFNAFSILHSYPHSR